MRSEICVIGGGPAGLAAALALTQSGREVTVLDCAVPPIDKACGEGLMPDSVAALNKLGVRLPTVGCDLRGIRFFDASSAVSADFPNGSGRGIRRVQLHELLVQRAEAAGIRMLWGVKNVHTQRGRVSFAGGQIRTTLIVGADGQQSTVRDEAKLGAMRSNSKRYGFRKHFGLAPWSPYVEIYWGNQFQIYITPVAQKQVCVALVSKDPHLRLGTALGMLPNLAERLKDAPVVTPEKGSLSVLRRLRRVVAEGYVLLGDASGSVDAITGEGMCLAFKQSAALVEALDANNLNLYEQNHRKILAKPTRMAALLLLLGRNHRLQRKSLAALQAHPQVFASILGAHVDNQPLTSVLSPQLVSFGMELLIA